jgi:hypothetical protein
MWEMEQMAKKENCKLAFRLLIPQNSKGER